MGLVRPYPANCNIFGDGVLRICAPKYFDYQYTKKRTFQEM